MNTAMIHWSLETPLLHVLVEKNAKMACLEEGVSLILYSTKQLIQDGTMSQLVPGGLEGKDGTMPWQLQWNFRKPTPSPLAGKTPPLHANGCTRTTKNRGKRQKILNEEREPAVPSRRLSSLTHGADQRLVGAVDGF